MGEPSITHFGMTDGLPDSWTQIIRINGEPVIYTLEGLYRFTGETLEPFDELNQLLQVTPDSLLHALRQSSDGSLWVITEEDLRYIPMTPDGTLADSGQKIPFIQNMGISHIYADTQSGVVWLGHSDGLVRFDPSELPTYQTPIVPIIRTAVDADDQSLIQPSSNPSKNT